MREPNARVPIAVLLSALAVACGPPPPPPEVLTILHVGDLHAHYAPGADGISPYARLKGLVERTRAQRPNLIFTGAGDDFEKGSIAEQFSRGRSTTALTHALGFDVRVVGNHDFAWGAAELLTYARDPRAIVLASNTRYRGDDPQGFAAVDYRALEIGALRVGFFGFVAQPWDEKNEQYEGDYLPQFATRYDYAALAEEIVEAHRDEVDLLVMLSHLGEGLDRRIAEEVDDIDLVLGGHSHATTETPVRVGDTLIVHAGWGARRAALLDLEHDFGDERVRLRRFELVEIDAQAPDDGMRRAVDRALERYAPGARAPLTRVAQERDRRQIAQLTAGAVRELLEVDATLVDPETIWVKRWRRGPLSWESLHATFLVERQPPDTPGFNSFYLVELPAADLPLLEARLAPDWGWARSADVEPGGLVTIAVQRHAAFHPDVLIAPDVEFGAPTPVGEAWAVLGEYARRRQRACLYLDSGARIPDCR